MKARHPRGSTLLLAMGATVVLALIVSGVLAYTGGEQARSGRSVRDLDAQACAESAAQWGRKFYGENYDQWNTMLPKGSGYSNPEDNNLTDFGDIIAKWKPNTYGRIDGQTVTDKLPADFRVTISDNVDEFPKPGDDPSKFEPRPDRDNDLHVILRAECLIPRLKVPMTRTELAPTARTQDDRFKWYGKKLFVETPDYRVNKVILVDLFFAPDPIDGSGSVSSP